MSAFPRAAESRRRLLFLIGGLGPGGAEIQARYLLTHLPEAGVDVRLGCFGGYEDELRRVERAGVAINRLHAVPRAVWPARVLADVASLIRRHKVEIVQTFLPSFDILAGAIPFVAPRVRVLTSRRVISDLLSPRDIRLLQWSNRRVDRIVANSHAVAESVRRLEGFEPPRLTVIPNGVPLPSPLHPDERHRARAAMSIPDEAFTVAYLSHFRRGKGYGALPEVLQGLAQAVPNTSLIVAGDMSLNEGYRKIAAEFRAGIEGRGLSPRVQCLGAVAEVRDVLAAADVLLNLSEAEGMSNSIMEAMAHGLAVVATDVGGARELIEDGVEGWIVPRAAPEAAAERLAALARDPELRRTAGERGRRRIERDFSIPRMVERYVALYEEVIAGPGTAAGRSRG